MSIQIITGFTVNSSTPLDNRIVASGAAARNSIPYKYVGLRVFDTSNNRSYYYNGVTFSAEITDQVNGGAGYVPVFTSQNYIGNSRIFQLSSGNERRIGISTNNPTGVYTYMQIGGMSLTEDPGYFPSQSLPLTIHKGGTNVIASNWFYNGGTPGHDYFNPSKGSSLISLGNEGDFYIWNRPGGAPTPIQTIYLSNNNKVGIGSNWNWYTLPTEALDVTGNIKASGFLKGDGYYITNITAATSSYSYRSGTASYSDISKTASNINVYNAQVSHPAGKLTYMMFSSTASNSNGASVSTYYYNSRGTGFAFDPDNAQLLLPNYYATGPMYTDPVYNGPENPPIAFGPDSGIYGSGFPKVIPGIWPISYTLPFIAFSISGATPLRLSASYSYATSPIRYINGSSTEPSITFANDIDSGIYKPSGVNSQIAFTTNGIARMHIKGTNAGNGGVVFTTATTLGTGTTTKSPYIQVGAVSTSFSTSTTPDYTWYGYTQSGMYMPSDNVIAFSTAGTKKLEIKQGTATDIIIHSPTNTATLSIFKYDLSVGNGYTVISSNGACTIDWSGQSVFIVSSNFAASGNVTSAGVKPFTIEHPHPSKSEKYNLVHAAIESSRVENLYRGKTKLSNGLATINLDEHSNMTEGTFVLFNRDPFVMTTSEDSYIRVKGDVNGNILTIESETPSNDSVNWVVISERCDINVINNFITDDNGRLITEQIKPVNK